MKKDQYISLADFRNGKIGKITVKKKRQYPETDLCKEITDWIRHNIYRYPSLCRFYHEANEGDRKPWVAVQMGFRAGVSDYHYAARTDRYIGLYLEIKAGKNTPTTDQTTWIEESIEYGYQACWCNTAQRAIMIIEDYAKAVEEYRKKSGSSKERKEK